MQLYNSDINFIIHSILQAGKNIFKTYQGLKFRFLDFRLKMFQWLTAILFKVVGQFNFIIQTESVKFTIQDQYKMYSRLKDCSLDDHILDVLLFNVVLYFCKVVTCPVYLHQTTALGICCCLFWQNVYFHAEFTVPLLLLFFTTQRKLLQLSQH